MKKILMGLALLALVACIVNPANADPRRVLGGPLTWVKADGAGSTTYDSTRVSITWNGIEAATMAASGDTTQAFDLSRCVVPRRLWATGATDSTADNAIVAFLVQSWATGGTRAATTDSSCVAFQFSYDGNVWTTLNASTGCWYKVGHSSNTPLGAVYYLNRSTAMNYIPRFVRLLVNNVGAKATALVRYYEVRPIYWTE